MSDKWKVEIFNHELDNLLGIPGCEENEGGTLDAEDMEILHVAARLDSISCAGEPSPWPGLKESWAEPRSQGSRLSMSFLRFFLAGLIFLILASAVLIPVRQPVLASLGRLFGYIHIPGGGFVAIDTARVLKNPIIQLQKGSSLLVLRGLAGTRETQLWLKYNNEARPGEGAWLETTQGLRFELNWWGWDPDEPGTQGLHLIFPPLPADIKQVTLAMPEGWRIPLEWIPASESDLQPADVLVPVVISAPVETSQETLVPGALPAGGVVQPCSTASGINFCVQGAAFGNNGLEVLVEALSSGKLLPGAFLGRNLVEPYMGGKPMELLDQKGNAFMPADYISVEQVTEERLTTTLTFPNTQKLAGRLNLQLPSFYTHTSLVHEIVVDLGPDPFAGQQVLINETVDVAGTPVYFRRAWVDGDGVSTLRLFIASDPVETRDGITPYFLEMGKPEGIDDRYGGGTGEGILSLQVELLQASGKKMGVLRLPLVGATMMVEGPFSLTFDAPQPGVVLQPSPQVVDDGEFIPLPIGEPLAMDVYNYSGLALQPGDFVIASLQGDTSRLYVSNLLNGAMNQLLAVLPGQVLAAFIHPDRQGIDFITGDYNSSSQPVYQQLYTVRLGVGIPRLLVGAFQRQDYGFSWSKDGRWLAYFSPRNGPGENGLRRLVLVDLACRETGDCQSRVVLAAEDLDLFEKIWSPVDNRLAVQGIPPEQGTGMTDIFVVSIDPQTGAAELTNLTNSPQTDDRYPQWMPDGSALMYPCVVEGMGNNEYGLCRNTLVQNMDELVVRLLPFNMQAGVLTLDGQNLIDRFPVFENGILRQRLVNIISGETRALMEWPTGKVDFHEPLLSTDGHYLAIIEPGLRSLLVVDLVAGTYLPLPIGDGGVLFWGGWVR